MTFWWKRRKSPVLKRQKHQQFVIQILHQRNKCCWLWYLVCIVFMYAFQQQQLLDTTAPPAIVPVTSTKNSLSGVTNSDFEKSPTMIDTSAEQWSDARVISPPSDGATVDDEKVERAHDAQQNPLSSVEQQHDAAYISSPSLLAERTSDGATTTSGIKVAYAISITGCPKVGDTNNGTTNSATYSKPPTATVDGPAVLAHSIRRQATKYPTDLIAFVHPTARQCTQHLPSLGYIVLERELGFQMSQIRQFRDYPKYIKYWGCCEEKEFIKLEAYTLLNYSVVMHLDTDLLVLQPMDAIVEAMMGIDTSDIHVLYKKKPLPTNITFLYTRDYVQMSKVTNDTSKLAVQGGFFAVRPNLKIYRGLIQTVKKGDYDMVSGWGSKGYGGYYGSPQIQGMLSYYYGESKDRIKRGAVELHPCYYNSMVSFPPFNNGKCRYFTPQSDEDDTNDDSAEEGCQDCAALDLSQLHSTHYTVCYKPWVCPKHKNFGQLCKDTHRAWFETRRELELSWGYDVPTDGWNFNVTQGYCRTPKSQGYIPLRLPSSFSSNA